MPHGSSALLKLDELLIAVTPSGAVNAFDAATGEVRWSRGPSGKPWQGELLPATISEGRLAIGSERRVVVIDAKDGKPLWTRDEKGVRGVGLAGSDLAVTTAIALLLLDARDGSLCGSAPIENAWSEPLLTPELVVVQVVRGGGSELVAFDRRTLERRWKVAMPANLSAPKLLASGGFVYAGLDNGLVIAVGDSDGAVSEVIKLEGRVRSISSDGDDGLLVGTSSGQFARVVRSGS